MLVIDRKISQRILIKTPDGQTISIMLTDCSAGWDGLTGRPSGRAKIGIDAPQDFIITREPM